VIPIILGIMVLIGVAFLVKGRRISHSADARNQAIATGLGTLLAVLLLLLAIWVLIWLVG
jgi:hypothetical protein